MQRYTARLESSLAGVMPDTVRANMRMEMAVAVAYGAFYACIISFTPVVLRRSGASAEMLAVYNSLLFLGSILTTFSVILMRRRRPVSLILTCWSIGRSLFLLCAIWSQATALIALSSLFWLLEAFVIPAYGRVMQKLYPDAVRGKVMSTVRMGQVAAILLVTPLAGWALDHWGHQVLFPVGSLMGILATFLFSRIQIHEEVLPPRQTQTFRYLLEIVREDKRFGRYLTSFALLGLGTMMSAPLYPIVQVDRLHLSYSQVGLLGLVESIFWLFSYLFWGRFLDRYGAVSVLRAVCLVSIFIPGGYIWANNAWMLIPTFMARGMVSAGFELGRLNAGIQLATGERFVEYGVIQSTVIGIRGIIAPMLGVALLHLGLPDIGVFAVSVGCMAVGWWLFGFVEEK